MKKRAIKFILISSLLGLTLMVFPTLAQGQGQVIDKIIARANDYIILKSDLEYAYQNLLAGGQPVQEEDKCEILSELIKSKVVLAKAEIDSIVADPGEIKGELDRRMAYFISQAGGQEKLESHLGKTVDQLKEELKSQVEEQLIVQKVRQEINSAINVRPREIQKYFNDNMKRNPPFYPLEVEVGEIVKYAEISNKQKDEVFKKLFDLKKRILAGEDFGILAGEYSEDFSNASKGGELGWFNRGELAPEFEATALTMEINEISDPVETEFGYHLIQLLGRKGKRFQTRHILIRPQSSVLDIERTQKSLDSLRNLLAENKSHFEIIAFAHSDDRVTKSNGGFFKNSRTGSLFLSTDLLEPSVFFVVDTMKVGSISKALRYRTDDGKEAVRIIYYKSQIPAHYASLDIDYEKIYNLVLLEKQQKAFDRWVQIAIEEVFFEIDSDYKDCGILDKLKIKN